MSAVDTVPGQGWLGGSSTICDDDQGTRNENAWKDVTRRETLEGAEKSIDTTIDHYKKKVEFINGPKVVKTFK